MILLALDQATRITGYAIFENDKLKTFGKIVTSQDDIGERLVTIREKIQELIEEYQVDTIIFEDIQLQEKVNGQQMINNVQTFKKLAEVFGVVYELATELKIKNEAVLSSSWKSVLKIKGQQRTDQKRNACTYVQTQYSVKCSQDEADAICIGTYYLIKNKIVQPPKKTTNIPEETFDWS